MLTKKRKTSKKEFKQLVNEKENKDLDFKLELPESDKAAQLVCAFYNSRGGKIILGVEDTHRKLAGLKEPQKIEHKFVQIIRHWCKLDQEPEIEFIREKNKNFIIIYCPKGKDTPYFVRGEHVPRVRIGSSNMPANKEETARLYREGSARSQDSYPVENAGLEDLDLKKIKDYFKESKLTGQLKGKHFHDLLKKEHFAVSENNRLVPTIAGIVLFGKHPPIEMPHTIIRADRYKGLDVTMWIDRADIEGDAFTSAAETEKFMLKNIRTSYTPRGFKTEVKTEYPIEALKEAITNAIAHRDYHIGESILVKMFDDRIEIWSPGELLRPLTIDQLNDLSYRPKSRNRTIANVFSRKKLMDKRGTGILRMNNFCDKWKLPRPEFKEQGGYFGIIFTNPNYYTKAPEIKVGLNKRQKRAVEYVREEGRITTKEYSKLCSCSERAALMDLTDLVNKHIIVRKGRGRATYYAFNHVRIPQESRIVM
jgi:ATP-dependent DNA helicase RecG